MFYLFLGVLGIGIRLNVAKENLIFGAIGGILSTTVFNISETFFSIPIFITAFSASVYSEIMAHIRKTPVTVFLPLAIIPILPGKAIYNTINLGMHNNIQQFLENSISIFYTTVSIALGIITVHTLEIIFSQIKFHKKTN